MTHSKGKERKGKEGKERKGEERKERKERKEKKRKGEEISYRMDTSLFILFNHWTPAYSYIACAMLGIFFNTHYFPLMLTESNLF